MFIPQTTIVEGIAHPETEAIVQAEVDQDPTVDPDINTETIVLTGATDNNHIIADTTQTPETDITHLIKSKTTIDRDPEATHLLETTITPEIDPQKEETIDTKAGHIVEIPHFTQKLMLSIWQNSKMAYQTASENQARGTCLKRTIEIQEVHQAVTSVMLVEIWIIMPKTVINTHSKTHHTLDAQIAV